MPLRGKIPVEDKWQKAPAPSLSQVESWAERGNVGLRTGTVSGVVVLDDDTEDGSGVAGLALPTTVTVRTGSGRAHYYFRCPEGGLTNARGSLPEKVDVRGDGGQVVFVGSVHPDTGDIYDWNLGLSPDDVELAEMPANVLDLIRGGMKPKPKAKRGQKKRPSVSLDDSARKALSDGATSVAAAPEGKRNDTLNREAFGMGRWLNNRLLSREEVEDALMQAALSCGLDEREASRTIRSGLDAGSAQPDRLHGAEETATPAKQKPSILVEGGALPRAVNQAEDALLAADLPIFQRGTLVVRTVRGPAATMRDVYRRTEGPLTLLPVDATYLVEVLTRVANWYRPTKDDLRLIDCPERVASTYLARAGHWRLRRLLGVIEAPTLRPNGSLLSKPGYDEETCLWFDPGFVEFPTLPESPTRGDALAALGSLMEVIKDFPWLEESDHAAALAAILTALIRHSLRTAPMFAFRAPEMASGKSLLADVVAMIAAGRPCSVMSQGRDEDEDKKRMLAILLEGISVACIDNIERPFGGATLCSILTQESWRERILGKTGTATVPTTTTWLATGNNLQFVGDIVTRVVVCDLDPKGEKPDERVFDVNLHEYVPANRGKLVAAGLTILQAYRAAGSPDQSLPVFGRFEEWSGWVRSALVWLGLPDPCSGWARLRSQDPVGARLRALLLAWYGKLGTKEHTAAAAVAVASDGQGEPTPLFAALLDAAPGAGGQPDTRRLGNYLSKYERRAEAGLRIERMGERQGVVRWRVVPISPRGQVGFVGSVAQSDSVPDENVGSRLSDPPEEPLADTAKIGFHRPPAGNDPRDPRNPPTEPDSRGSGDQGEGAHDEGDQWPVEDQDEAVAVPDHRGATRGAEDRP